MSNGHTVHCSYHQTAKVGLLQLQTVFRMWCVKYFDILKTPSVMSINVYNTLQLK